MYRFNCNGYATFFWLLNEAMKFFTTSSASLVLSWKIIPDIDYQSSYCIMIGWCLRELWRLLWTVELSHTFCLNSFFLLKDCKTFPKTFANKVLQVIRTDVMFWWIERKNDDKISFFSTVSFCSQYIIIFKISFTMA